MKKTTKVFIWVFAVLGVLALLVIAFNNFAENKIKKAIEEKLTEVNADYGEVDVKLLSRKAEVINSSFSFPGKEFKVDTLELDDIHIWDYIMNKDLIIGNLNIKRPVVKIYKGAKKDSTNKSKSGMQKKVEFKNVTISKGSFELFPNDSSDHNFLSLIDEIKLTEVSIDSSSITKGIPFNYKSLEFRSDSLFFDMDKQHRLVAANLKLENQKLEISDFRIVPKYSKTEHQQHTDVEKDRYDLQIKSIVLDGLNWNMKDSLSIKSKLTTIDGVDFEIYRNKLLPDDTSFKPLYSQMIRKLSFNLGMDSVNIRNAYIKYEENIHKDNETGSVEFSNLNAEIANITNIGMDQDNFPRTKIHAEADFMKAAPLNVDWEFDISNKADRFQISGQMGRLAAEQINQFLKPAMNVKASGEISNMYFNFTGNDDSATGDMRLEYKDFKVEVLQKDGTTKNNFVSALANLIVGNKALNEKANYKKISVQRDKQKSFWNYLWNCVKSGALKAFL